MTKSTITRERLEKIKSWRETYGAGSNVMLPAEEAEELARMALAAMDSEPVAEVVSMFGDPEAFGEREIKLLVGIQNMPYGTKFYRHAQPAPERDQVRREHAEWSQTTFGNVGPIGPLKHLSKEALEAAAEPDDLSEWADMQFLLWDAQRRAGITDEQITQAMIEKLAVNKLREWPAPKDGEPRLHIKEQPAPVVPYVLERLRSIVSDPRALPRRKEWISGQQYSYVLLDNVEAMVDEACRAAMLQAGSDVIGSWGNGKHPPSDKPAPIDHGYRPDCECSGCKAMGRICAELAGWIPVSERMPERKYVLAADFSGKHYSPCQPNTQVGIYADWFDDGNSTWDDGDGNDLHLKQVTHWMPLPAAPQEVKGE